jgi:hypothetical protein
MSDFSELCPLFATGVFHCITFPRVALSTVSVSANLLAGTNAALTYAGNFTFGRTVVVTEAWVRQQSAALSIEGALNLVHKSSAMITGTIFGSVTLPISVSQAELWYSWKPFVAFTGKTFTSNEVLALQCATRVSSGAVDLMVRYKEK